MESASPASLPIVARIGTETWSFRDIVGEKASYDSPKTVGSDGMEVAAILVLQVRHVERRSELRVAQGIAEVTWNAPVRLERRSNVVAVAASLALMARRAKKMKRNCRFAIAALQHFAI